MGTTTRSRVALISATLTGVLVWVLHYQLTGKKEAWDSSRYYFYCILISSVAIALASCTWKEVVAGLFAGQLLYCLAFLRGGGEFSPILGLIMTMPLPLVGALGGWAVGRLLANYRRRG